MIKILPPDRSSRKASLLRNKDGKVEAGFALIATISVMVLLFMIAVAMLTLSSVELRSARAGEGMEEARANARLALMTAIAELQAKAGADTRVTAPADAVAGGGTSAPRQLTGVWRSWEGNNHDKGTGLPTAPDYDSKLVTGEVDFDSSNEGRFLGWLISGVEKDNDADSPPTLEEGSDTVPLLAEGSLGTGFSELEVHLVPTPLSDEGGMAYWIQGENTKAYLKEDTEAAPANDAEWSQRLASNGRADIESFGFNDPEELAKGFTLKSLDLISNSNSGRVSESQYHNLTRNATGLLTNTANGGWRRDLSLMAEKWNDGDLAANGLPVFSTEPYEEELTTSLRLDNDPSDGAIYPWVTVDDISMSWNALMDFTSLYRKVERFSNGEPFFTAVANLNSEWITIWPVLARTHWTLGHFATETSGGEFQPRLLMKPGVTLWNPYNVAIESETVSTELRLFKESFPFKLFVTVGSQSEAELDLGAYLANNSSGGTATRSRIFTNLFDGDDTLMKPGESRVYGKSQPDQEWSTDELDPGINIAGNYNIALAERSGITNGAANDPITYRWERNIVSGFETLNVQFAWSQINDSTVTSTEGTFNRNKATNYRMRVSEATADEKVPLPAPVNTDETLGSAANEDSPFLSISIGLRTFMQESPSVAKLHTKGYFNSKLITSFNGTAVGESVEENPYTWELFAVNAWADPSVPSEGAPKFGADRSGLVGNSFQPGAGLESWTIAELPTQPLLSLAELQHFDSSFNNDQSPRVANAIGNSHASPQIAADEVVLDRGEGPGQIKGYDHSYVNNHILFDDWFVSSITPDYEEFTQSGGRSIEDVYSEHLSETAPLPNGQYLPAKTLSDTDADARASEILDEDEVWRTIASEIEVEGMFNINSTSVDAWKALLMSQRGSQVPVSSPDTSALASWETTLDTSSEFPVTRTTVAGGPSSSTDPSVALLAEHMSMNEDEVEALATEIVEQIKKRGPFLSLSEFINRQLRDDDNELAMAGTIEAALIELSKASSNNPYSDIQSAHPQQVVLPSDANSIYQFPEAAEGYAVYGTPGWARQADIIRPLAPIMSARDDTFKIRAYGESKDPRTGRVIARSWCEAVVQRRAGYVDVSNDADESTDLLSDQNKQFGRRFEMVSFRWLSEDEI